MLGLLLGVMALGVPILAVTGVLVWLPGWRNRPRLTGNAPAAQADTIVLVGSEGGSTWGFAATLAHALRDTGQSVHVAPMTAFQPARYRRARRFLILAATYGEGDAPASAKGFLAQFQSLKTVPTAPVAVLGFGDRSFPAFCAFARAVDNAARDKGCVTVAMPACTSSHCHSALSSAGTAGKAVPVGAHHNARGVPAPRYRWIKLA